MGTAVMGRGELLVASWATWTMTGISCAARARFYGGRSAGGGGGIVSIDVGLSSPVFIARLTD